jgi:hypothetical protein
METTDGSHTRSLWFLIDAATHVAACAASTEPYIYCGDHQGRAEDQPLTPQAASTVPPSILRRISLQWGRCTFQCAFWQAGLQYQLHLQPPHINDAASAPHCQHGPCCCCCCRLCRCRCCFAAAGATTPSECRPVEDADPVLTSGSCTVAADAPASAWATDAGAAGGSSGEGLAVAAAAGALLWLLLASCAACAACAG